MDILLFILLNELMTFLTMIVVFPGLLPARYWGDSIVIVLLVLPMSLVWWVFLITSPVAFLIMWAWDDLDWTYWTDAWPWNLIK